MNYLLRLTIRFLMLVSFLCLTACAETVVIEEGSFVSDSRQEEIWREERTGDHKNLGPNAPGYLGPGGEYQVYPDADIH